MTKGLHVLRVDLPRPRHEASRMDPTVHGSWPRVFLFFETAYTKQRVRTLSDPTHTQRKSQMYYAPS